MSASLDSMGWPSSFPVTCSPTGGSSHPDLLARHRGTDDSGLFELSLGVCDRSIQWPSVGCRPQPYVVPPRCRGEAVAPPDFSASSRAANRCLLGLRLMGEPMADREQEAPVGGRLRNGARAWYESLSPLRIRSVRIYLSGQVISLIGIWMQQTTQAFIGDIAGMARVREAIILNASIFQVSRMIGPALAGWGIGYLGVASAFWINGVTFLAVIASLLAIRGNQVRRASTGRPLQEFREGLAFLRKETRAQDLLAFSVMVTFFGISSIIILPAVVSLVLGGGADMLGFLLASSGAGALVGALVLTSLAQRARRTGIMLAANVVWTGVWLVLFSFSHTFIYAAIAIFFVSLTIPVVLTTANGLLQILAPPDMRGRVLSIFLMISFGAQPIAAILIGVAADLFTPMGAVLLNGALMVVAAGVLVGLRSGLLSWEARPAMTAAAGPPSR